MQGITITVTGGSNHDNAQMCTTLQSMMQNSGFTNVSIDPASECVIGGGQDVVMAMRALNPDLFDTPVTIEGSCEYDSIDHGSISLLSNMLLGGAPTGFVPVPQTWGVPGFPNFFGLTSPSPY